jgi:hypothetical protein
MQASKTPAYVALIAAVAAGALLSPHFRPATPPAESISASPAPASPPPTPAVVTSEQVQWQKSLLTWQNVTLNVEAPIPAGTSPSCHTPAPNEDEVGTCFTALPGEQPVVWNVATVTQRDRFVPVRWFSDAESELRQTISPQQLLAGLVTDVSTTLSVSLSEPSQIALTGLSNVLALTGKATYRENQNSPVVTMTCVAAYLLAANRPTQMLYCAMAQADAIRDATRMAKSLRTLNPSRELTRNSVQSMERAEYLRYLKTHGGAAKNTGLVTSEIDYFASVKTDCQVYGEISQERYACNEEHAKARIAQLSVLETTQ